MRNLLLTVCVFGLVLFSNTSNYAQNSSQLEGTWKLVKTKWGDMKEHKTPEREIYKIFTEEHFFFVYYNDKEFAGAGGGTYNADARTFTETLAYYSWDSTAVGTQQTFNWTLDGKTLHQTGLIKGTDKYNDYVIDEYYERVEDAPNKNENSLAGVWQIEKGTYGESTQTAEESRWRINKVFTDKFWYATFYDPKNGAFNGMGFGTYILKGKQYIETLNTYSWDNSAAGKTYTFTMDIQPKKLIQRGEINSDKYEDYTIIEYFKRVE